ncbi:Transcriptional regulator, Crp/Fnr family [Burkholderiales bacterium]|nr:Transcriptional regulator, Crp/Fnr family [Burkholderiales bacterium]
MPASSPAAKPSPDAAYAIARAVLETGTWYRALPAELRHWLLQNAVARPLQADERLFSRGDPPCGLYAVVQGAVRVTGVSAEGKEALLTLMEPPHWFGEIALFDGLPRTHDALADTCSLVLQVPQAALHRLLADQPQRWHDFGMLLAHKLRLAFVAMEETALLPAAVRLARRLLLIAAGYGERPPGERRLIAVRQEQLAMMLSLSRQTTNQILRDLEERGIAHLTRGEIEILNFEQLRAAATQ